MTRVASLSSTVVLLPVHNAASAMCGGLRRRPGFDPTGTRMVQRAFAVRRQAASGRLLSCLMMEVWEQLVVFF